MNHRLTMIDKVFIKALDLPREDRSGFLEQIGRSDPELQASVQSLLQSSDETDPLLAPGGAQTGPLWQDLRADLLSAGEPGAGDRVGRYRIVREIGRGGMAVVYLAEREDGSYDQEVALKVLSAGVDTDEVTWRFAQERQILASLRHPAIARLLDGGRTPSGRPFLVMEHVEGQPIDAYCEAAGLGVSERLRLFLQVARAVSYAHQNLVVHRDLKPSNILVSKDGLVKLLDFGIAKLLADDESLNAAPPTRAGVRPMTPEYASPEQARGDTITTASDVYQLGLLLFELLTGHNLLTLSGQLTAETGQPTHELRPMLPSIAVRQLGGKRLPGWLRQLSARRAPADQPHRLQQHDLLRGDLDAVASKALQVDPLNRYATAELLCQDIELWLRGQPVSAAGTAKDHLRSLVRRRSRTLAAAASVLILVTGLTALYLSRLIQERSLARSEAAKAAQISGFIVDIFEGANPDRVRGKTVTARELLDRGARQIASGADDQSLTEAELAVLLAEINCSLGSPEQAEQLLEQALRLSSSSPRTAEWKAEVLVKLAALHQDRSPAFEAHQLLPRPPRIAEGAFDPEQPALPWFQAELDVY